MNKTTHTGLQYYDLKIEYDHMVTKIEELTAEIDRLTAQRDKFLWLLLEHGNCSRMYAAKELGIGLVDLDDWAREVKE